METFFIDTLSASSLQKVVAMLLWGEVIVFPTETVYGLGASVLQEKALKKIFKFKGRPTHKGLIVHLGKIEEVKIVAEEIPDIFFHLAEAFFPGPLTLVVKKKKGLSSWISEEETVAVRMPSHPVALELIQALGHPIVGTSANLSGQKPALSSEEVVRDFSGKVAAILEGGDSLLGVPSTILTLVEEKPRILREGALPSSEIFSFLKSAF